MLRPLETQGAERLQMVAKNPDKEVETLRTVVSMQAQALASQEAEAGKWRDRLREASNANALQRAEERLLSAELTLEIERLENTVEAYTFTLNHLADRYGISADEIARLFSEGGG